MQITRKRLKALILEEIRTLNEGWIPDNPVLSNPSPEGNYFEMVAFPKLSVENQSGTGWLDFLENSDPHLARQVRQSMYNLVREEEPSTEASPAAQRAVAVQRTREKGDEDEARMDLGYRGDYS